MTPARATGLVLVLAGIVWGTIHDRLPLREIPRVDGRFLIAGDFHVHAFVGDGGLAPWELRREARRRELDVIAVTNHNQRLAAVLAARAPGYVGNPLVIVGQEITAPTFHLVAAGIHDTIDWRLGAGDAIRAVQAQGGVAIAAHPTPVSWRVSDADALTLLDGVEMAHPGVSATERGRRELAKLFQTASATNSSLAPIGSSDFHFGGRLGLCRTYLFVDEISERGVLDAIREARTVAADAAGRLSGDAARVEAVRALVARHPPPLRADLPSRTASWISLAGLLILLVFR
jgi:PHP domain-containing protein